MSDHGATTAFNSESLENFNFLLFILILCIPVYEKHKQFLVWEHVVSAQEAATALNRENVSFFIFVYINFRSSFSLNA